MKLMRRLKEVTDKFFFCYKATGNIASFISLVWFTKLYHYRKGSNKYINQHDKFFSIILKDYPGKKIYLRIYAGDIEIFYEIFYKEIYKLPCTKNNNVIVDAGANVGFATLYFLKEVPNASVFCIEPDPENFVFLKKNLHEEIERGQVTIALAALSGKDGVVNLMSKHFKYNSQISDEYIGNSEEVVSFNPTTFFNKFNIERVDLCKIDIEGAEESIFKSDLSWLNIVKEIIIEFHSPQIAKLGFDQMSLQKFNLLPNAKRAHTDVFHFVKNV